MSTGWAKKRGHRLMTTSLSNLNQFTIFFTGKFLSKFAVKWILHIPPHLAYVATLPCETTQPCIPAGLLNRAVKFSITVTEKIGYTGS